MATLIVPPLDEEPWPTLGPVVCDFIEAFGVYGPGDLAGEPYKITDDFRAQLFRAYEVYPKGHPLEGRRRFKQCSLEERKGTAKTERGALVVIAETHPEAEVRFDGWRKVGRSSWEPVGRPMSSPMVPMIAFTVEQVEELGYGVLRFMLENGPAGDAYDVGLDRVVVLDDRGREAGRITALAGSPGARDGARTTFAYFDEPHRMNSPRLRKAWTTMGENIYKRREADAWTLTTSTAGESGEDSVEEAIWREAESIARGESENPRLFFFRRFAPPELPLETRDDVMAALVEASGPNASWSGDLEGLVDRYFEEKTDKTYFRRVWLNQWGSGATSAFDVEAWRALEEPRTVGRELITLGFDGSIRRDCTALVATAVHAPYQWPVGIWARPPHDEDWEVPWGEVDAAIEEAFDRWPVWRLYGDPFRWREPLDRWAGRYGSERIISWNTTRWRAMGHACRNYATAISSEAFTHDGDAVLTQHIGNTKRRPLKGLTFDDGSPLWTVGKDRPIDFIDGAVAGLLSWEARNDAIKAGAKAPKANAKTIRFR